MTYISFLKKKYKQSEENLYLCHRNKVEWILWSRSMLAQFYVTRLDLTQGKETGEVCGRMNIDSRTWKDVVRFDEGSY